MISWTEIENLRATRLVNSTESTLKIWPKPHFLPTSPFSEKTRSSVHEKQPRITLGGQEVWDLCGLPMVPPEASSPSVNTDYLRNAHVNL